MPTPIAEAIYGASAHAQGTAALSILLAMLRALAHKRSLSMDDVDLLLAEAEKAHRSSTIARRHEAAALIAEMRQLLQ